MGCLLPVRGEAVALKSSGKVKISFICLGNSSAVESCSIPPIYAVRFLTLSDEMSGATE